MGNASSKELQGRPSQRLSKPRVANNATAGLLNSNGPPNGSTPSPDPGSDLISIPYSTTATSLSADTDRDGDADSDKKTFLAPPKPQRRLSLFRSKSSQESSERRKSRRNTIIGSPSFTSESRPVVRANSVATHNLTTDSSPGLAITDSWPSAGCRASWAYDLSSYEAQRILNLVQEQPPQPSRDYTALLFEPKPEEIQTSAWRRNSMPLQSESAPISRSNSEMSLHPPMRRRSLIQTPGVATRTRPGPVSARSSFRHSHPATPILSRQASFESPEARVVSYSPLNTPLRATEDIPRVATPKEEDYGTTGAFKFGTLRIINGNPDLTKDILGLRDGESVKVKSSGSTSDCFTDLPSRGSDSTSETKMCLEQSFTQSIGVKEPRLRNGFGAKPASGPSSKVNVPSLSVTISAVGFGSHFASDFQLSPDKIQHGPPVSPSLETQSKSTAVDDRLFEDDDSGSEISAIEVLDVRIDPSAKGLHSQIFDPTQAGTQPIKRPNSDFVSNSVSGSSKSHSSLAKADSGYSSNASVRSLRGGKKPVVSEKDVGRGSTESSRESPEVQGPDSRQVANLRLSGPAVAGDDSASASKSPQSEKAPPLPPREPLPAILTSPGKIRRKPVRCQPPVIDTSQTLDRDVKPSESVPLTPASGKSDDSASASSLSIGSNSQKHGRLHRLLSLRGSNYSKPPLTVHVTHVVDKQVPSVPQDVQDKLREHTGLFPITTKRLALRSQMSKETLKTILSVGSLEHTKEDDLPPTPNFSDSEDEEGQNTYGDAKDNSLRQTFNSMQTNFRQAAAYMMPNRKPTVRKALPRRRDPQTPCTKKGVEKDSMLAAEMELTSYTSVNTSLGNNAYEVATKAMAGEQAHSGRRAGRPMTITAGQDTHLQLKTYSLKVLSSPSDSLLTPTSPILSGGSPSKKQKTPPPVSMATRGSFRTPPPRSPSRPQGPAVLGRKSRDDSHSPSSNPTDSPPIPPQNPRRSLESVRRAHSTSALQYRTATWDPSARHGPVSLPKLSPGNSRHNSVSSVRSDLVRRSLSVQPLDQHLNGPAAMKRQSSQDGFGPNQLRGVYVPQPPHQRPIPGTRSQLDPRSSWNGSQIIAENVQWGQPGRYPPYVPRGHRRYVSSNSRLGTHTGTHTGNPPYRILHSYNSPAYKNAPIWG